MNEIFNKVKHFFIKMYNRLKKYFKSFNFDLDLNPDYKQYKKNIKELEFLYINKHYNRNKNWF